MRLRQVAVNALADFPGRIGSEADATPICHKLSLPAAIPTGFKGKRRSMTEQMQASCVRRR